MSTTARLCPHCFLPSTSELMAHWSFEGTLDDVSPYQRGAANITPDNTSLAFEDAPNSHIKSGYMKIRNIGWVNIPPLRYIETESFTFTFSLRLPTAPTSNQVLLSNWSSNQWQFITYINSTSGVLVSHLRRNIPAGDSDPDPSLVDVVTSQPIPIGSWFDVAVSFDSQTRTSSVYVNGKKSNASVVRSSITDLTLRRSLAGTFQLGWQADSATASGMLNADVRNLRFFKLHASTV